MTLDVNKLNRTFYSIRAEVDSSELTAFFPAPGRENYLQWVKDWKAALNNIIAEIREKKKIRGNPLSSTEEKCRANFERQALRPLAHNMIALRLACRNWSKEQVKQIKFEHALAEVKQEFTISA